MKAQKEKLRVVILTANHRIRGEVHLYENSRLTDILNADNAAKDFLPVTEASYTDLRDGKTIEVSFLSVNRKHIEMVMEDDEAVALGKARDLINKRNYKEALTFTTRAIKASPNNAEAHYWHGFCLSKNNETKLARTYFEQCAKLARDPELAQKAKDMLATLI